MATFTERLRELRDLKRLNLSYQKQSDMAAHFDGEEFTEDEWEEIERFKMFVKSKREN